MAEPGALEPLRAELAPAASALAKELRTLFDGLGISLTRYAALVHRDKSVVSRYLSGDRIPEWNFVHELLVESTMRQGGTPPTQEVVSHLNALYWNSLENSPVPAHQVLVLQERLANADAAVRRALKREQDVEAALEGAQRRIAELEVSSRELAEVYDRELTWREGEIERHNKQALDDRRVLLEDIAQLRAELEVVHSQRLAAELRAENLECELLKLEEQVAASALESDRFADELSELIARRDQGTLNDMDLDRLYDGLWGMNYYVRAEIFESLAASRAAEIVDRMQSKEVAEALNEVNSSAAAEILNQINPVNARSIISEMQPTWAAGVLDILDQDYATEAMKYASPFMAKTILSKMEPDRASYTLELMYPQLAAPVLEDLEASRAGTLLGRMHPAATARLLAELEPVRATYFLGLTNPAYAADVLSRMEDALAAVKRRRMRQERSFPKFLNNAKLD